MNGDNNNIQKDGQLSRRVVHGSMWVTSSRVLQRCLTVVRTIVIARLLSPDDFGLFGIAMLALAALERFSVTGFDQALIQKKEHIEPYLDPAWTIQVIRGFVLGLLLFCAAPLIAKFFGEPQIILLLKVLGVSIFIGSFRNIGIVFFQKNIEFNKIFAYELSGTIADFVVALTAAFILRNAWALIFGFVARNVIQTIVSYIIHPYRPRFLVDKEKTKSLLNFGQWVWVSSILIFLVTQGDDILVGKLLGVAALGFYQLAYKISNMPTTEITHVISQVTFPAYSKIQDNVSKLRDAYLKVLQLTVFLSFPVAGLIFVLAPDFTMIFLGEKWMPMVPSLQVLVFAGLIRSIAATQGNIFYAVGKPKIDTVLQVIRLAVIAIFIYPFSVRWGILGASIVVLMSIATATIGFSVMSIRITKCDIMQFAKPIILPLINIGIVVFVILKFRNVLGTGIWQFLILFCTGTLLYLFITLVFDKLLNNSKLLFLIKDSLQLIRGEV